MAGTPDSVILEQLAATEEAKAVVSMAGKDFTAVDLLGGRLRVGSRRTASQGCVRAPLADSITEESHEATRSAAVRVSMVEVFTAEAAAANWNACP